MAIQTKRKHVTFASERLLREIKYIENCKDYKNNMKKKKQKKLWMEIVMERQVQIEMQVLLLRACLREIKQKIVKLL